MQILVGPYHGRNQPGVSLAVAGRGTAVQYGGEIVVAGHAEPPAAPSPSQPTRDDQAVQFQDRAGVGRPPGQQVFVVKDRPGKDSVAVSIQQPMGREFPAQQDQPLRIGRLDRRKKPRSVHFFGHVGLRDPVVLFLS